MNPEITIKAEGKEDRVLTTEGLRVIREALAFYIARGPDLMVRENAKSFLKFFDATSEVWQEQQIDWFSKSK